MRMVEYIYFQYERYMSFGVSDPPFSGFCVFSINLRSSLSDPPIKRSGPDPDPATTGEKIDRLLNEVKNWKKCKTFQS